MLPVDPGVRHRAAAGWNGSNAAGQIAHRVITWCRLNPDFCCESMVCECCSLVMEWYGSCLTDLESPLERLLSRGA